MAPVREIAQFPTRLTGEMWGVTTYFNPAGYATKLANLQRFSAHAREQGLKLLVVELAATDAAFVVDEQLADRVLHVRSDTVLWHKERLLNLGIQALPQRCDKVVWLDNDLIFENPQWIAQTSELLERYVVVQPFATACWLPEGEHWMAAEEFSPGLGEGNVMSGMGKAMSTKRDWDKALANYFQHGHCGFAWAARRDLLAQQGLYERAILGGGDVVIARAMYSPNDPGQSAYPGALAADMQTWRQRFYEGVRGSVLYTPGRVLHLWHGQHKHRGYDERRRILMDADFDPQADITVDEQGCWVWHSHKPELRRRIREYFLARREDG